MITDIDEQKMPLIEHLIELRKRIFYSIGFFVISFMISYYFIENIYDFLVQPLADLYDGEENRRLIYTSLTEAFFTYVKLSCYCALFLSFPFFATQIYIFLAPGLYKKEKLVLLPFIIATPFLFFLGGFLVYKVIFPIAWEFFLSFENTDSGNLPIQLEAKVSEYLSLVISLIFAFGITFQLPVLLTLLARVGFISSKSLINRRKYAIIGTVTIAAIITPPDVISQIGLAIAMYLLYELSIFLCKIMEK